MRERWGEPISGGTTLLLDHPHDFSANCQGASDALSTDQRDAEFLVALHPVGVTNVLRHVQASAMLDCAISVTLAVDESVYVNADEGLLTSAVSHLLHHAIKFSGVGARVTLSCQADEDGVVVEVEHDCGGLAEDESARLSSTFHASEADESRRRVLAMTQRAVAAMFGRIAFATRPNHGCTFRLTFPPLGALRLSSRSLTDASCASHGHDQAAAPAAERL
jgi:signal transduction histidine kinase